MILDEKEERRTAPLQIVLFLAFTLLFLGLLLGDLRDGEVEGRSGPSTVAANPGGYWIGISLELVMVIFGMTRLIIATRRLLAAEPPKEEE